MQWASTRRDIFPATLCHRLEEIQWQVQAHPWKESKIALYDILNKNTNSNISLAVKNQEPIGSGCIAQVYKGKLFTTNKRNIKTPVDVAIKIIHPDVYDSIRLDLEIMKNIASFIELIPRAHWLSIHESVEEFSKLMENQIDLRNEAKNMDRFLKNFANNKDIQFAKPIYPFVSQKVLVQSFIQGK